MYATGARLRMRRNTLPSSAVRHGARASMDSVMQGQQPPAVLALFAGHEQERGTCDAPTKAGFLALARAGSKVWNAWRAAWPISHADFSDTDFTEAPVDFAQFVFGD